MKRMGKRLFEMLVACIGLSTLLMIFIKAGAVPSTQTGYFTVLVIGAGVYIAFLVNHLRRYWRRAYTRQHYFMKCYAAYGIFALLSLLVYFIFGQAVFAWLFCITMPFHYTNFGLPLWASILLFHCIMLAVIALAPLHLNLNFLTRNPAKRKRRKKKASSKSKTK